LLYITCRFLQHCHVDDKSNQSCLIMDVSVANVYDGVWATM